MSRTEWPVLGWIGGGFEEAVRARSRGKCELCRTARAAHRCNDYKPSDALHLCAECVDKHVVATARKSRKKEEPPRLWEDKWYAKR